MSAPIAADVEVRQLQPSDLPAVMAITSVAYRKEYHESPDAFLALIKAFPEGNFVALVAGEVVAYSFSHPSKRGVVQSLNDESLSMSGEEDCYYLHDMCVHPAHQRRGITRLLYGKILATAAEHGFDILALVAVQKSRKFWESKGFVSRRKLLYGGLSAHYMETALDNSAPIHG